VPSTVGTSRPARTHVGARSEEPTNSKSSSEGLTSSTASRETVPSTVGTSRPARTHVGRSSSEGPTNSKSSSEGQTSSHPATFEALRRKRALLRKKLRHERQQQQPLDVSHWTTHQGTGSTRPTERKYPENFRGQMYPTGAAANHPAAPALREWAVKGCPVNTGAQWTKDQIVAALERGPHMSALEPEAMQAFRDEVVEKVKLGQARIITWDDIKDNPPKELKLSPISQIPHKSRKFRTILDLSFTLKNGDQTIAPAVNSTTEPTAPEEALGQMGSALPRLIVAMARCPDDATIYFTKFDIQDGFWRMINELGKEYNFAFVMPTRDDEPLQIVVPTSLQMGWVESPPFFCGASETARDVADEYAEAPLGTLPEHPLEGGTKLAEEELQAMLDEKPSDPQARLKYLIEVYVDDFIAAAQATSPEELKHIARALLHAIHDVFPEGVFSDDDQPVSVKKIKKGEAQWSVLKEVLGWLFDGKNKSIQLPAEKVEKILEAIKAMLRSRSGTPFKAFQELMGKLYHASLGVPAGKGFMTPLNRQLAAAPKKVWFRKGSAQRQALELWRALLVEAMAEPTLAKELVPASPDYVGLVDASGEGVGGVWLSGNKKLQATVWRLEWPQEIKTLLATKVLTINDLEMAGNLLGWLVLEGMGVDIRHCHVALLNDNASAISWIVNWASHSSGPAGRLIIALALRQRVRRASPLTPAHLAGKLNVMADLASRSFGYKKEWHCDSWDSFLTLFNRLFPLPNKSSWQAFQLSSKIVTRVTAILQMKEFGMEEWKKLPKIGTSISTAGASSCSLGELTRSWATHSHSKNGCISSQVLEEWSGKESWAEDARSELVRSVQRSLPLRRPSHWTKELCPSTTTPATTTCRSD